MIGIRRNPLLVGAVTAFSLVVLSLSAVQISRFVRFGDLPYLARQLQRKEPVARQAIAASVSQAEALRTEGVCQSEFVKGGMSILLADLDYQDQDKDYESWAMALERADKFARFALGCLPTDGNLWLRLAMVQQTIVEEPEEVAKLVTFSQLYTPADENVIVGRYLLYNRVTARTLMLLSEPLASDLRIICSDQNKSLRRRLLAPGPLVTQQLAVMIPDCDPVGTQIIGKTDR